MNKTNPLDLFELVQELAYARPEQLEDLAARAHKLISGSIEVTMEYRVGPGGLKWTDFEEFKDANDIMPGSSYSYQRRKVYRDPWERVYP